MSQIKIYHLLPVTRSTRVIWLLEELDEATRKQFEIITHNITKPETYRTDEFRRISPTARFPVLVEGDFVLLESPAIVNYILRNKAGNSSLLPKDPKDLATYESVNSFVLGQVDGPVFDSVIEGNFTPKEQQTPGMIQKMKTKFDNNAVPFLNKRLESGQYIVSNEFTAADITLGLVLYYANMLGWLNEHPKLKQYFERVSARPAFLKSIKQ